MNRICPALAVAAWLIALPAGAQAIDGNGVPFRLWDFNAGAGLHFEDVGDAVEVDEEYGSWRGTGALGLQVGRYWTSHLKTEAALLYVPASDDFGGDPVPLPGGLTGFATFRVRTQLTHLSGALTYQFFENVFAHPYVSAGARIGIGSTHRSRDVFATVYTRGVVNFPIPPIDEHRTIVQVRPFAAAGFKSYFTERTFVRSELSTAFSSRGLTQLSLGLGFGVDF
jgi:hypothetical protein